MTRNLQRFVAIVLLAAAVALGACSDDASPRDEDRDSVAAEATIEQISDVDGSIPKDSLGNSVERKGVIVPPRNLGFYKLLPGARTLMMSAADSGGMEPGAYGWDNGVVLINVAPPCTLNLEFTGPLAKKVEVKSDDGSMSTTYNCLASGMIPVVLSTGGFYTVTPKYGSTPCDHPIEANLIHDGGSLDPLMQDTGSRRFRFDSPGSGNATYITITMSGIEEFETPDTLKR